MDFAYYKYCILNWLLAVKALLKLIIINLLRPHVTCGGLRMQPGAPWVADHWLVGTQGNDVSRDRSNWIEDAPRSISIHPTIQQGLRPPSFELARSTQLIIFPNQVPDCNTVHCSCYSSIVKAQSPYPTLRDYITQCWTLGRYKTAHLNAYKLILLIYVIN